MPVESFPRRELPQFDPCDYCAFPDLCCDERVCWRERHDNENYERPPTPIKPAPPASDDTGEQ